MARSRAVDRAGAGIDHLGNLELARDFEDVLGAADVQLYVAVWVFQDEFAHDANGVNNPVDAVPIAPEGVRQVREIHDAPPHEGQLVLDVAQTVGHDRIRVQQDDVFTLPHQIPGRIRPDVTVPAGD